MIFFSKNVPTKLSIYDDCDHAIDGVAGEADFWMNTKQGFDQYLYIIDCKLSKLEPKKDSI